MKPDELDDQGRAFIPDSPDILAATKLIEPHQKTALKLTRPTEEGDLRVFLHLSWTLSDYVGTLIVTKNVDDYLASHPQPALPSTSSKIDTKDTKYE